METPDTEVDATGLDCPMPLLLAKRALNALDRGQSVLLRATDSTSLKDFKVFTDQTGHLLLVAEEQDGVYTFLIEKR